MNRMKEVRVITGCKVLQLATQARVSTATISQIEKYDYTPQRKTQDKIAQALNVTVEAIWPGAQA